jgi:hypothetical protein
MMEKTMKSIRASVIGSNILLCLALVHAYPVYDNAGGLIALAVSAVALSIGRIAVHITSERFGSNLSPSRPLLNMIFILTSLQMAMTVFYVLNTVTSSYVIGDSIGLVSVWMFRVAIIAALTVIVHSYRQCRRLSQHGSRIGSMPSYLMEQVGV